MPWTGDKVLPSGEPWISRMGGAVPEVSEHSGGRTRSLVQAHPGGRRGMLEPIAPSTSPSSSPTREGSRVWLYILPTVNLGALPPLNRLGQR